MSKTAQKTQENAPAVYDADARNRFAYSVVEGGQKFKTAHIFDPLTDERYMQWLREFKIRGDEQENTSEAREATVKAWDDTIFEVENVELGAGEELRDVIPYKEKINAFNDLVAVAAFEPDEISDGKRRPSAVQTQTVLTEAHFNGAVLRQTHVLKASTIEWEKKYARIQSKRFRQEVTKGLRRAPKVEFVPQDHKLGELYDEMCERTEGFAGRVPLRFKTQVIHHIFDSTLEADEKK